MRGSLSLPLSLSVALSICLTHSASLTLSEGRAPAGEEALVASYQERHHGVLPRPRRLISPRRRVRVFNQYKPYKMYCITRCTPPGACRLLCTPLAACRLLCTRPGLASSSAPHLGLASSFAPRPGLAGSSAPHPGLADSSAPHPGLGGSSTPRLGFAGSSCRLLLRGVFLSTHGGQGVRMAQFIATLSSPPSSTLGPFCAPGVVPGVPIGKLERSWGFPHRAAKNQAPNNDK